MILRRTPQMLKKIKNRRKQNFEDEANTQCNCIKRTLNEST